MSTFQKACCLYSAFLFILSALVKTFYEQVYYNLHNELWFSILPQVIFCFMKI